MLLSVGVSSGCRRERIFGYTSCPLRASRSPNLLMSLKREFDAARPAIETRADSAKALAPGAGTPVSNSDTVAFGAAPVVVVDVAAY